MIGARARFITGAVAIALVIAGCSDAAPTTPPESTSPPSTTRVSILPATPSPGRPTAVLATNALVPFDACEALLDYIVPHAVDMVGPYGLEGYGYPVYWRGPVVEDVAAVEAPTQGGGTTAEPSYSTTNLQEVGVDEPDLVKTDGRRIVALTEGRLIVVDVTGAEPEVTGILELTEMNATSMFLYGDRVLLMTSAWSSVYPVMESEAIYNPGYHSPTVGLVEIDISTGDPEPVRTMTIDGAYISARMVNGVVRLVITSGPVGFEWEFPKGSGLKAERAATEANRALVRNSTADNWIPYVVVADASGDTIAEGSLFDCTRANHPSEFSGLDMLSLATIDMTRGLEVVDATGLLATGDTVYASSDNLYVATQQWRFWGPLRNGAADEIPDSVTTDIHQFDISRPDRATYVASGQIDGYLLSQFAMSEKDGLLRTASTTSPTWWTTESSTQSLITVLEPRRGELVEIGRVEGLGKTERIYSVRFVDDMAYVVTFRQTDPLYTVDLSDPEHPAVVGELKIAGYSAYLHPIETGLILGVGQDANDIGRVQGSQMSLFDVSDPSNPVRVDSISLEAGSSSTVEWDHHAFLYWEDTGLAVIPVQQWNWDGEKEDVWFGALAITVNDGEITDSVKLIQPGGSSQVGQYDWRAQILRSVVVDDALYTISAKGIMKSGLDGLDELAFATF